MRAYCGPEWRIAAESNRVSVRSAEKALQSNQCGRIVLVSQ
jgi:hypothetical protein